MPASTAYNDVKDLTPSNQGIENLRELIMLTVLKIGALSETMNIVYGARNGKIVGGIGEFGLVGEAAKMCNPEWNNTNLAPQEKKWELGPFMIKESICADDFVATVAQFAMKTGTDKADMSSDDLVTYIIEPRLLYAIEKGLWRVYWMGDTDAENVDIEEGENVGGDITAGIDVKFFNMTDGLFKRLYAIAPTGSAQRVAISANAQATKALQLSSIFTEGLMTTVMDNIIYKADMKLRQKEDRIVLMTQSAADALAWDIKKSNKGSDLQWESLFDGLVWATKYNGETIYALPIWDEMIRSFNDLGATYLDPHRVVYASKETLMGGIESTELLNTLKIWFSQDTQTVKILARDEVGTMVWEDNLVMFGY